MCLQYNIEDSISRKFCNNKAWDEKHYKRTRATTQPCGLQHRSKKVKSLGLYEENNEFYT